MSSAEGDRGDEAARDADHLTRQFLTGNQKRYMKNILTTDHAIVGKI
jgi:hypothetical protein